KSSHRSRDLGLDPGSPVGEPREDAKPEPEGSEQHVEHEHADAEGQPPEGPAPDGDRWLRSRHRFQYPRTGDKRGVRASPGPSRLPVIARRAFFCLMLAALLGSAAGCEGKTRNRSAQALRTCVDRWNQGNMLR